MARPLAFFLLVFSAIAYICGITFPVATTYKETLLTYDAQPYSILSTISELHVSGETGLAVLIALFSIAFPIAKYISLFTVLVSGGAPKTSGAFRLMKRLGKWSMLDVFVVALLIVMMKVNGQSNWLLKVRIETEPGLFIYAISVASTMILASRIGVMSPNKVESVQLENGKLVRPCGFWIRLWAMVIDAIISAAIVLPVMLKVYGPSYFQSEQIIQGKADFLFNWVLPVVVTIGCWSLWQATPGKLLIEARIVDARTGHKVPLARLFGRYLGYYLSLLPLGIGAIWVGLDSRRQGWHDKVARTMVVEVEKQ